MPCACMKYEQKCTTNACKKRAYNNQKKHVLTNACQTIQTEPHAKMHTKGTEYSTEFACLLQNKRNRSACQNAQKVLQPFACLVFAKCCKMLAIYYMENASKHKNAFCMPCACMKYAQKGISNACKTSYMQNASKHKNAFCMKNRTGPHAKIRTKSTEQYSTHCACLLHA